MSEIPSDRPHFRPLRFDPARETVSEMFDARDAGWIMAVAGDYQAAAVETVKADGTSLQRAVALEWPGRRNHTTELVTVRLMMSPEDALGLADVLAHTGAWMLGTARLGL